MLETRVEVLGVLADDDQVDVIETCLDAGQTEHRPEIGVQIQRSPDLDVDTCEASPDRGADRAFERDPILADGVDHSGGERRPFLLEDGDACLVSIPLDVEPGTSQHEQHGLSDLGTDAVTWNQRDAMAHAGSQWMASGPL